MPDDTPRRRWNDDRLDDMANEVRALRTVPTELAKTAVRQENVDRELEDFKGWIGDVETRLSKKMDVLDDKIAEVEKRVLKSRRDTLTAVIAFAAPVTVAVIGGVVALITGTP